MKPLLFTLLAFFGVLNVQAERVYIDKIIMPDGSDTELSGDVEWISFGEFRKKPAKRGELLGAGDELRCPGGKTSVQLKLSDATELMLAGAFHVVIAPDEHQKLGVIKLHAGEAHSIGPEPTIIRTPLAAAAARGTHYVVVLSQTSQGMQQEVTVFDGRVDVQAASGKGARIRVNAGQALEFAGGETVFQPKTISAARIEAAASLYSRADAGSAAIAAQPANVEKLRMAHIAVLQKPLDASARLNLVATQLQVGARSRSSNYQLARAKATAGTDQHLLAQTLLLSAQVYTIRGDMAKAAAQREALSRLPQAVVTAAAAKFTPPATRRLTVSAKTDPAAVKRTVATRVIVGVADASGAPVPGAKVVISAGGGSFTRNQKAALAVVPGAKPGPLHSFSGTTDAKGAFVASWSCASCAAGYTFSIEVSKEGFDSVKQTASVKIQP